MTRVWVFRSAKYFHSVFHGRVRVDAFADQDLAKKTAMFARLVEKRERLESFAPQLARTDDPLDRKPGKRKTLLNCFIKRRAADVGTSSIDTCMLRQELDAPFTLSEEHIAFYSENGYIKLKHVFSSLGLLEHYRRAISCCVAELSADAVPIEQRTTYGKAFLQVMNLWTKSNAVKEFVFGKRLGRIAAELMGVTGVRIYHDQALYKEAGGGITPWHADQYYWPVSSDKMVTAWVPFQDTPREMGPLAFCEKSHRFQHGRDFEISDESEIALKQALSNFRVEESNFNLGDVSFHAGWTFHRAGANSTNSPREVMTMIYMDENIRLVPPKNKNQAMDAEDWCPGVQIGDVIASPRNPVLYSKNHAPISSPVPA